MRKNIITFKRNNIFIVEIMKSKGQTVKIISKKYEKDMEIKESKGQIVIVILKGYGPGRLELQEKLINRKDIILVEGSKVAFNGTKKQK